MPTLFMLAASLLFAAMGVCVKLAGENFNSAEIVFWRGFIALLMIGVWMVANRSTPRSSHWRVHLTRSIAGTVALMASFMAMRLLPLPTAVTLGYTSPLFLAVLVLLWHKELVRRQICAALVLGFAGIALLLQPTFAMGQWWGVTCGLVCGALSAVAYLNVRRLGQLGEPAWRTVFYFSLVTTLAGLPWVLCSTHEVHALADVLPLLGVGMFGAVAQLCLTAAYKHGRTLATASISYTTVVFSSLMAWGLWDEILTPMDYGGIALILAAGAWASLGTSASKEITSEE